MKIYDELVARGLIAQVTDEAEIKELVNNGKATFYIGFDATADSLTAGHFLTVMAMMHMQRAGHRPIALLGGGTTMIGDPTGKSDMRTMMTKETIMHNAECFHKQLSKFIDFESVLSSAIVHSIPSLARSCKVFGPTHNSGDQKPFGRKLKSSSILFSAFLT